LLLKKLLFEDFAYNIDLNSQIPNWIKKSIIIMSLN